MTQARDRAVDPPKKPSSTFDADAVFKWLTIGAALVVPIIMTGIFWELLSFSWLALKKFGWRFFITEAWNPVTQNFGAASSIYGTVMSTLIAMVLGDTHEYRHRPVFGGTGPPASAGWWAP